MLLENKVVEYNLSYEPSRWLLRRSRASFQEEGERRSTFRKLKNQTLSVENIVETWVKWEVKRLIRKERWRNKTSQCEEEVDLSFSVLWFRFVSSGWSTTFFFFFSNLFIAIYLTLLFALKNESTSRLNISISLGLLFSFTKAVAKFVHYLAPWDTNYTCQMRCGLPPPPSEESFVWSLTPSLCRLEKQQRCKTHLSTGRFILRAF